MARKKLKTTSSKRRFRSKKKVKNLDKRIKNIERRQELRWIDTFTGLVNVSQTGNLYLLNASTTGDSPGSTRQGAEISTTSLQVRYHIYPGPNWNSVPTEVRVIFFWDMQPNSGNPTILRSVGSNALLDDSIISAATHTPFSRPSMDRYRVIYDKTHTLHATNVSAFTPATGATTTVNVMAKFIKKKFKLGRIVKYTSASPGSGSISDIITNALWCLTIGSSNLNDANFTLGARLYFKDD